MIADAILKSALLIVFTCDWQWRSPPPRPWPRIYTRCDYSHLDSDPFARFDGGRLWPVLEGTRKALESDYCLAISIWGLKKVCDYVCLHAHLFVFACVCACKPVCMCVGKSKKGRSVSRGSWTKCGSPRGATCQVDMSLTEDETGGDAASGGINCLLEFTAAHPTALGRRERAESARRRAGGG